MMNHFITAIFSVIIGAYLVAPGYEWLSDHTGFEQQAWTKSNAWSGNPRLVQAQYQRSVQPLPLSTGKHLHCACGAEIPFA
jgi:hypothetical protein